MKILLSFLLSIFPVSALALEVQPGVLPSTVSEVKYAETKFNLPLKTWLGFLPGNDERDPLHKIHKRSTLIFHHEEPKADKHYLIVWSHGMGGYHKFASNMYPQMKELIRSGKSFTIVEPEMPWSCNVSHIDGRQSWSKKGSFKTFVEAAKKQVPMPKDKKLVLVVGGHSRGGKSIRDASTTGGLCDMNPDWIIWSDATYSGWLHSAWHACLRNIAGKVEIFYIKGTSTASPVKKLGADPHFDFVHVHPLGLPWYHGKVGDNALLLSDLLK